LIGILISYNKENSRVPLEERLIEENYYQAWKNVTVLYSLAQHRYKQTRNLVLVLWKYTPN